MCAQGRKLTLNNLVKKAKVTKNCTCPDWDIGIGQIRAQQAFCHHQSAGLKYDGPVFEYCPWCGSRIYQRAAVPDQAKEDAVG